MELVEKQGYKQTEVGLIPNDWEIKSLMDLSEKVMVGIASAATHAYTNNGIVLFRNQNIKPNYLDDSDILHVTEEYEIMFKGKRLKEGDLLTARTGYPGTTCIVPRKYENSQSFTTLITRPIQKLVLSNYLSFYINSEKGNNFFERSKIGGGQKNVNSGILKFMPIPLPKSIKEQKAIATALSDVDELISNLDRQITKKKAIKQGAMQQLLTPPNKGGKRLTGFNGEWVEKSLGELGECIIGLTYKPTDVSNNGTLVLRSSNIQNDQLSFKDNVFVNVDIPKKLRTQIDDILVCVRNGSRNLIGKCARIDSRCVNESFGAFMSVYRSPYNRFISHLFKSYSIQKQIEENLGATINQITNKTLNSFIIWFPEDEKERTAISNIIDDISTEISELETKKAKYQAIKQGMMQELLTGKTRLM